MSTRLSGAVLISAQDVFTQSATQLHRLGELAVTNDGRAFRYCKAGGTALVAGHLEQAPALVANHQNLAVVNAAAIGATSVTVTLGATAATANQYAEGWLFVNDETGEGHSYRIKSHPAADASANLVVTLEDPVRVALVAGTSEVSLCLNPYNGVIDAPTTATGASVGVAPMVVTEAYFGWVQTHGPIAVLMNGTPAADAAVSHSNAVAGSVESGVIGQGVVGNCMITGVDTEYQMVYLTID